MDKLKRVLNGNDDTSNAGNNGIINDVGVRFLLKNIFCILIDADESTLNHLLLFVGVFCFFYLD